MVYNNEAISVVENGDFLSYVKLGEKIQQKFDDLPSISMQGYYEMGEGYRLQAEINTDEYEKSSFYQEAQKYYSLALEIRPDMPRCLRGLARIAENQNDFGTALEYYDRAIAQTFLNRTQKIPNIFKLIDHHEILRLTRHRINCILAIQQDNPLSNWNFDYRINELTGEIYKCENLHREILLLPYFKDQTKWCNLEWFFCDMILAKAWESIGAKDKMIYSLVSAIRARGEMMINPHQYISNIEYLNLKWWLNIAKLLINSTEFKNFLENMNKLEIAIESKSLKQILWAIDNLTIPYLNRGTETLHLTYSNFYGKLDLI